MSSQAIGVVADITGRRERAVAHLSPAARHQAFPTLYAKPLPIPRDEAIRVQNEALKAENERSKVENAWLKKENTALREKLAKFEDKPSPLGIAVVTVIRHFLEALVTLNYRVEGFEPFTIEHLRSARRCRRLSRPRQVAMALCRELCVGVSLPKIGRAFGGKDHTTIMHSCRHLKARLAEDPILAAAAEIVRARVKEGTAS